MKASLEVDNRFDKIFEAANHTDYENTNQLIRDCISYIKSTKELDLVSALVRKARIHLPDFAAIAVLRATYGFKERPTVKNEWDSLCTQVFNHLKVTGVNPYKAMDGLIKEREPA